MLVLDSTRIAVAHKAQVKMKCVSLIFLVVYSDGETQNFAVFQCPKEHHLVDFMILQLGTQLYKKILNLNDSDLRKTLPRTLKRVNIST